MAWSGPVSRVLCRCCAATAVIHLGRRLLGASSGPPGSRNGTDTLRSDGRGRRLLPVWPCTRWGFPSQAGHPTCWCALTAPFHPYRTSRGSRGGLFSVALSLAFRPVGVTHHRVRWCPDFPPVAPRGNDRRPPGPLQTSPILSQLRQGDRLPWADFRDSAHIPLEGRNL